MTTESKSLLLEFDKLKVVHRIQREAHERLQAMVEQPGGPTMTLLTGPTGSGKTTLLRSYCAEYLKTLRDELERDLSRVPIFQTTAVAGEGRAFSWKRFYRDAQIGLGDPFANIRQRRPVPPHVFALPSESLSAAFVRLQLEEALKQRRTSVWVVDEAQHALYGSKVSHASNQCDILKSIGQTTGVNQILAGPYQLPKFLFEANGQLSRRTRVVELGRYRYQDKAERAELGSAMNTILKGIPSKPKYPDVRENFKFYYVGCLGCVGIFKDWAALAYDRSLQSGTTTISLEDFEFSRLSPLALEKINAEIVLGETLRPSCRSAVPDDLVQLILYPDHALNRATGSRPGGANPRRRTGAARPGERNPTRDPVGSPCPVESEGS